MSFVITHSKEKEEVLRDSGEWKWVSVWGRWIPSWPISLLQVPLNSRYEFLESENQGNENVDEDPSRLEGLSRAGQANPHIKTYSIKKIRRVVVIGDSLLRGMEDPVCQPHPAHKEVWEPGEITKKLPSLAWPTHYCSLVFQVDTYKVPARLRMIKWDLRAFGQ